MFMDLTDVLRGPGQTLEKSIDIAPARIDDLELSAPIRGRLRVENARQSIVVRGSATTEVVLTCARCLQPTGVALNLEMEAIAPLSFFGQLAHTPVEDDEESEADDEIAALFEGHSLDVLELVRQSIELQTPIQPLCSPDCAGLPEAEKYSSAPDDDRWNALKGWGSKS